MAIDPPLNINTMTHILLNHTHDGSVFEGRRLKNAALTDFQNGAGPVFVSPNGSRFRLGVANDGTTTWTEVT